MFTKNLKPVLIRAGTKFIIGLNFYSSQNVYVSVIPFLLEKTIYIFS